MSVQGLMQKGMKDCSGLEKFADAVLKFPRAIWLRRNISMEVVGDQQKMKAIQAKSFLNSNWGFDYGQAFTAIGFSVVSVVAALPLVIGLVFKKIAITVDKKSDTYHQIVEKALIKSAIDEKYEKVNEEHKRTADLKDRMKIVLDSVIMPEDVKKREIFEYELLNSFNSRSKAFKERYDAEEATLQPLKRQIEQLDREISDLVQKLIAE